MAELLTVKYTGKGLAILAGKAIFSGEVRSGVHPSHLQEARRTHPDGFKVLSGAESVSAETLAAQIPERPVSEAARKLAEANGVDLEQVTGTGAGGGVTKPDVERWLKSLSEETPPEEEEPAESGDVNQPE